MSVMNRFRPNNAFILQAATFRSQYVHMIERIAVFNARWNIYDQINMGQVFIASLGRPCNRIEQNRRMRQFCRIYCLLFKMNVYSVGLKLEQNVEITDCLVYSQPCRRWWNVLFSVGIVQSQPVSQCSSGGSKAVPN